MNTKILNESVENLLGNFNASQTNIPDINDILTSGNSNKKKKRVSIFDETPSQNIQQISSAISSDDIIVPKSLELQYQEKVVSQIAEINHVQELKKISEKRSKIKNKNQEIIPQEFEQKNQQVKQELETIIGETLPENLNFIELEEEIESSLTEIPDGGNFNITDLDIKAVPVKKDKTGYFKEKVGLKKENIPNQINIIASYVKKHTKGLVSPRVCDLRVIGNTNKTQLRGSNLKLSAATIVFKPDATKLKVNKGTRFMLSIPENYESTGNLIVYLQESRAKKILEITSKDFPNIETFNEFVGDRIAEFYFSGYEVTLKKIELRGKNNPLMQLLTEIVETREYKAKPYTDDESHLFAIDFISKELKNQWLYVQVIEGDITGTYNVFAKNTADSTWEYQISKSGVTIGELLKNMYQLLGSCYDRDWTKELDINDEDDKFYYLYDKLTHFKLKKALIILNEVRVENPEIELVIKETLSKKDTAKSIAEAYDAEAVIGKTKYLDYYILSYLACQVKGGDKRKGSEYTTTEEYREKYDIKNDSSYQQKKRTILSKEGEQRNYNSRIYLFQLEYSINGKKHIYKNTNWDELIEDTKFVTNNPILAPSKF